MTDATDNASNSQADQDDSINLPLNLLPDDIKIRKEQNVRKFKADPIIEQERIRRLALSLLAPEGQLQNCIVREEKAGVYSLIAGHRRREAVLLINSGEFKSQYNPSKQGPFTLRCEVRKFDDAQAKKAAITENLQRQNFSPMDLVMLIADVRADNGWTEGKDTKLVAEYLGVSPATVTQHEKLSTAPKAVKTDVHNGDMTVQAALATMTEVEEDKREAVAAQAKDEAKKEAGKKSAAAQTSTKLSAKQKEAAKKSAAKPVVTAAHVKKAARDQGALKGGAKSPRTKKDVVEFFEGMTGPASHPVMAEFAAYMVKFSAGEGTEGTLTKKWDAIAELLPKAKGAGKADKAA